MPRFNPAQAGKGKGVVVTIQNFHPYFHACAEAAEAVGRMEKEAKTRFADISSENQSGAKMKEALEFQHILHMRMITAPIFGAIAAENFIYNYGCEFISVEFCNENLDKLDTLSKWRVIPKLACGKDIPPQSSIFSELRELIKARNSLVHLKSKVIVDPPLDSFETMVMRVEAEDQMFRKIAKRSPKIIVGLVEALLEIDPRAKVRKLVEDMAIPVKPAMPNKTLNRTRQTQNR